MDLDSIKELQAPIFTCIVLYNSQSTISLPHKPSLHARIKHMELDLFSVRKKVLTKNLLVPYIPAQD